MFAYNPTVNDTSGQLQASGMYLGAKGIADGITSAAGAVAGGMTKKGEQGLIDRKTLDMNLGKMDQYQQAGLMDADTYGKFIAMPVNKQSGALAGFEATVINPYIKKQGYQDMANAQIQIKGAGSGAGAGGGGKNTYFMHTPGAGFSAISGSPMAGGYSAGVDNSQ